MELDSAEHIEGDSSKIVLGEKLWGSRVSQCYEGVFGEGRTRVLILKSQRLVPLDLRQTEHLRLANLIANFPVAYKQINPLFAGVLEDGFSYIVFPWFDLPPISYRRKSFSDRMALYVKCLQCVDEFVALGYSFDDVCLDVFRVSPSGTVFYLGLLGNLSTQSTTIGLSESKNKVFCSPEEIIGGQVNGLSNIFSLGVLGYYILSDKELSANISSGVNNFLKDNPPPSGVASDIYPWVDAVLGGCLLVNSEQRISSIETLLTLIQEGIQEGKSSLEAVRWMSKDATQGQVKDLIVSTQLNPDNTPSLASKQNGDLSKAKVPFNFLKYSKLAIPIVFIITIVMGVVFSVVLFSSLKLIGNSFTELNKTLVEVKNLNREEILDSDLYVLDDSKNPIDDRLSAFSKIVGINKQTDYLLFRYCREKSLSPEFGAPLKGIFDKYASTSSNVGSVEYFRKHLNEKPEDLCLFSDLLLEIIDNNQIMEARIKSLRIIFSSRKELGLVLSGFLAKETGEEIFLRELKSFLSSSGYKNIPGDINLRELVLFEKGLEAVVGTSMEQIVKDLSIEEVRKVIKPVLESAIVRPHSYNLLLDRYKAEELFNSSSAKLFELAQTLDAQNRNISNLIVLLGMKNVEPNKVLELLDWSDLHCEEVIYLSLALNQTEAVSIALIDVLITRGIRNPRAKILFDWLRENLWSYRAKYVGSLSRIVLRENFVAEEIESAFNGLMPISQHGLFDALAKLNDSYYLLQGLNRLGMIVESPKLSLYLRHENRDIRIAAVRALVTRNDLEALQIILRGYRSEKDQEIREIYNQIHWVTREREIPKNLQN